MGLCHSTRLVSGLSHRYLRSAAFFSLFVIFFYKNKKTTFTISQRDQRRQRVSVCTVSADFLFRKHIFFFSSQAVISPLSSGAVLYTFVYETCHVVSAPQLEKWRCFEALMSRLSRFTPTCSWKRFLLSLRVCVCVSLRRKHLSFVLPIKVPF